MIIIIEVAFRYEGVMGAEVLPYDHGRQRSVKYCWSEASKILTTAVLSDPSARSLLRACFGKEQFVSTARLWRFVTSMRDLRESQREWPEPFGRTNSDFEIPNLSSTVPGTLAEHCARRVSRAAPSSAAGGEPVGPCSLGPRFSRRCGSGYPGPCGRDFGSNSIREASFRVQCGSRL